jgi:hypothetical protein
MLDGIWQSAKLAFSSEAVMITDPHAISAAKNNADWYGAVFQTHGLAYHRTANTFIADDPTPPYYAHLTTTSPQAPGALLAELSRLARRCHGSVGLKDSFCALDPATDGFAMLFQASWIWRQGPQPLMPENWTVVTDPDDLQRWETDWKSNVSPTNTRMFLPSLLGRDEVVFLGQKVARRFVAGCIANQSADCVGLSNAFAATPSAAAFARAADATASVWDGLPVVGYKRGLSLDHARAAGFETVGELRVLVSQRAEAR